MKKTLNSFLFNTMDPLPIFFLRVIIGFIYFSHYSTHFRVFIPIYSANGLAGALPWTPDLKYNLVYWALYSGILVSSIFVVVGLFTRTSLAVATAIHCYFNATCFMSYWGWGYLILDYSYLLLLCDPGSILSLDVKWGKRKLSNGIIAWKLRAIQLLTCSIYFLVTINRFGSVTWANGQALKLGLTHSILSRFPLTVWSNYEYILIALTYYTLVIESLAAIQFFFVKIQKYILPQILIFHFFTELMMTVGYWQFLMPVANLTFMPSNWINQFYKKFNLKKPEIKKIKTSQKDKICVFTLVVIWLIFTFSGLPKQFTPKFIRPTQQAIQKVLFQINLDHFHALALFSRPKELKSHCSLVLGVTNEKSKIAFNADLDDCLRGNFRFTVDHIRTALFELNHFFLKRVRPVVSYRSWKHISEYFCQDPLSKNKTSFQWINYSIFINNECSDINLQVCKPRFMNIFSFNCQTNEFKTEDDNRILNYLKTDHPLYLDEFKKAGYPVP